METVRDLASCFVFGVVPVAGIVVWLYAMVTRSYRP